jgi:hypothetical protein
MIKLSKLSEHLSLGKGSGSSSKTASTSSLKRVLANGGYPATNSYNTHPSAHKSEAYECTPMDVNSSGAMYAGEPRLAKLKCPDPLLEVKALLTPLPCEDDDVVVDEATDALLFLFIVSPPPCEDDNIATFEATLLLRPKPHNFTSPCSDNKALLGFMSQCNNPAPCNARKPLHKSTANRRIDDSGNLPSCFKTFNSVPPTQYSKTNHKWFLVSYHATNFNARSCLIALNACTSCKTL